MWNLLLNVKGLRYNPSVSLRLPAQHKARPTGALSGEPDKKKASLEKGGGPPLGDAGIITAAALWFDSIF